MARTKVPIVVNHNGVPVQDATVLIRDRSTGSFSTLYASSSGSTTLPNPTSTNSEGEVDAYVERGSYNAYISKSGLISHVQAFESAPAVNSGIDTRWRKHTVNRQTSSFGIHSPTAFPSLPSEGDMATVTGGEGYNKYSFTFVYRTGISTSTGTGPAWVTVGGTPITMRPPTNNASYTIPPGEHTAEMPESPSSGIYTFPGLWVYRFSLPSLWGATANENIEIEDTISVYFMPGVHTSTLGLQHPGLQVGGFTGGSRKDLYNSFESAGRFFVQNNSDMWSGVPRTRAYYRRTYGASPLNFMGPWYMSLYPVHLNPPPA